MNYDGLALKPVVRLYDNCQLLNLVTTGDEDIIVQQPNFVQDLQSPYHWQGPEPVARAMLDDSSRCQPRMHFSVTVGTIFGTDHHGDESQHAGAGVAGRVAGQDEILPEAHIAFQDDVPCKLMSSAAECIPSTLA